jgi:2-polyprenyl-3-methyl-5-hydroxy-6-metoxy-1,4-benzoquinol methylase
LEIRYCVLFSSPTIENTLRLSWKIAQTAERKWWQIYLKNKDVASYHTWKLAYWKDLLATLSDRLTLNPEAKILDAGCGPAGIFMAFPDNEVTAFDPLIDQYEADLPHFKRTLYPNVRFVTAQIENFDDGEKYDTIFCMNAINHVADIRKSYGNLARLLQPNGKLVGFNRCTQPWFL